MLEIIRDAWRVIRRRDSESATMMVIGLAVYMNRKDCQQMADYFRTIAESFRK